MPIYYNADGNLQYFEEWNRLVVCKKCGKPYRQYCEEQVAGFRDRDYDICPYCSYENGSSMEEEYTNYALTDIEIAQYFANRNND